MAFGLVLPALPARAGFEWVQPPADAAASQSLSQGGYGAPRATNGPEVISPVVITGDTTPQVQTVPSTSYGAYSGPAGYSPDVGALPPAQPPALLTQPAPEAAPTSMSGATLSLPAAGGDVVQGFAAMVPLSLALRQILPVGYNFSIDQTISIDTLVSYKGGKSWRETMRDMLAPVGLVAREQGSTIIVSHAGGPSMAAAAPSGFATAAAVSTYAPSPVLDGPASPPPSAAPRSFAAAPRAVSDLPSVNVGSADGWTADRGDTLRKVLTVWCKRANVELQWLAEYDYPMEASAHFSGGFEDAVRLLLAGFENARPQPIGEIHSNPTAGQMLLVVQARGNNYSN